jgi:hypothetical protein
MVFGEGCGVVRSVSNDVTRPAFLGNDPRVSFAVVLRRDVLLDQEAKQARKKERKKEIYRGKKYTGVRKKERKKDTGKKERKKYTGTKERKKYNGKKEKNIPESYTCHVETRQR